MLQRSSAHINVDDMKIYSTPRRLIHSLQDLDDSDSSFSNKQVRRFRSPRTSTFERTPTSMREHNCFPRDINYHDDNDEEILSSGGKQFHGRSESVSYTEDVCDERDLRLPAVVAEDKHQLHIFSVQNNQNKFIRHIIFGIFVVLVAAILCLLEIGDQDDHRILVPT